MAHKSRDVRVVTPPVALLVAALVLAANVVVGVDGTEFPQRGRRSVSRAESVRERPPQDVIVLTSENFDRETSNGTWFVDIYAPWCQHCKQLEPTWAQLGKRLQGQIKVGKLDGTKEISVARRFGIRGYPSLYLLANGSAWHYQGNRRLENLEDFAKSEYKNATPLEFWKAPNSAFGRFLGFLWRIPTHVESIYSYLTKDQGISDLSLVGMLLLGLVFLAFFIVGIIDCFCVRQRKPHRD